MKYNIVKVFIIGSAKLRQHRKIITDAANEITTSSIIGEDDTKNIICIYSCDNTGQKQREYNHIIKHKVEAVIAIIENELGKRSYDELKLAKKTYNKTNETRPLLYGLKKEKAKDKIKIGKKTIDYKTLLPTTTYFTDYIDVESGNFKERAKELLNEIAEECKNRTEQKEEKEKITWRNDSFAYMTVEVRFMENYKIVAESYFEKYAKQLPTYDDFEETNIYHTSTAPINRTIEDELCRLLNCENLSNKSRTHKEFFRNAPFLIVEYYFYYYLLYLYHEKAGIRNCIEDPYRKYKLKNLSKDTSQKDFRDLLDNYKSDDLQRLIACCLGMNSVDLSQHKAKIGIIENPNCPINNWRAFEEFVKKELHSKEKNYNNRRTVNIITDNCGLELISDILLGSYLIRKTEVTDVVFHIKKLPIFVSDTIMSDVDDAIEVLNDKLNGITEFILTNDSTGERTYKCHDTNGKTLIFKADDIWHRETLFKEVTEFETWNSDDSCALIIVKGDLNYRRLVGDYKWSYCAPIAAEISYIKKPLLIIRSLKSNVFLGCNESEEKEAKKMDESAPNWKISGQHGIIQFIENK